MRWRIVRQYVAVKTFFTTIRTYSSCSFFTVFGFRCSPLAIYLKYQTKNYSLLQISATCSLFSFRMTRSSRVFRWTKENLPVPSVGNLLTVFFLVILETTWKEAFGKIIVTSVCKTLYKRWKIFKNSWELSQ